MIRTINRCLLAILAAPIVRGLLSWLDSLVALEGLGGDRISTAPLFLGLTVGIAAILWLRHSAINTPS